MAQAKASTKTQATTQKMDPDLRIKLETPRLFERGPFILAGLRESHPRDAEGVFARMGRQWDRFVRRIDGVPDRIGEEVYCAFYDMYAETPTFDMFCGVEARDASGPPTDFWRATVPAQRYIAFRHVEAIERVRNTVWTVWHEWLPSSGHQSAGSGLEAPEFIEFYGEDFDPDSEKGTIEVWFPIRG